VTTDTSYSTKTTTYNPEPNCILHNRVKGLLHNRVKGQMSHVSPQL